MIWIELVQMATLEDKWLAIRCASFVMGNNPTPCNRQELANEQRPAAELQQPEYSRVRGNCHLVSRCFKELVYECVLDHFLAE
jgi:hypothetical protein